MTLQEQFITERKIFKNVSPQTVVWYQQSLKRFDGAMDSKEALGRRIIELKERGLFGALQNLPSRALQK